MRVVRPPRGGFTLLELMVALVISVMIVTAGRALFDVAVEVTRRLTTRFDAAASRDVGRITIANAFAAGHGSQAAPFVGTPTAVTFESWCPDAFGGFGRCRVTISAQPVLALREHWPSGIDRVITADSVPGRFDYVIDAADRGTTVSNWESSTALPLAVRWMPLDASATSSDTLVFAILRSAP